MPSDYNFNAMMRPVPATAKFADPDYNIWCGSAVKGDDDKYHMFYSRWPRGLGHQAWVTHSEVAHAESVSPFGPWRHLDVALPPRGTPFWDGSCTHNPTVLRIGKRYYLYYTGNYGDGKVQSPLNWTHRNNQRIGVAVADSPDGPWQRFDKPVIDTGSTADAPDALMTSNPSVAVRPDGGLLMVYKAVARRGSAPFGGPVTHLLASSKDPSGPFIKQQAEVFAAKNVMFAAEDPFIWHSEDRYRAVVKDMEGSFAGKRNSLVLWESVDGIAWRLSQHPLVSTLQVTWRDGSKQRLTKLERPQVLLEDGQPIALYCAAADDAAFHGSFNIQIPLALSRHSYPKTPAAKPSGCLDD